MKHGIQHLGKITGHYSRPQFHLSLLESLASYGHATCWRKWERLKITGVDKRSTISLQTAVHVGHMLRALMTKETGVPGNRVNALYTLNIVIMPFCMQILNEPFFFLAGGKNTLPQRYIRRLANAMDELFLQKSGVHPSLVCDMYEYNYKKPGV
jgi:hypothetical protein